MRIKIVESIKKYEKDLDKRIAAGKLDKPETGLVMTPETFSKVFSPERIKLLQRVYKNKIKSIYQLAKEIDKPYEVVFRNIKYLEGIGLLKVIEKDNRKVPYISSKISVDMFVKA